LGVRPEFVRFADRGLPVHVERVSDIGRFRIVDARSGELLIKALIAEGQNVPTDGGHLVFDAARTQLYADGRIVDLDADPHTHSVRCPPRGRSRLGAARRRLTARPTMASAKTSNQKAWWLVLPVVLLVAFNAVVPLMAVVNYSVQETFGNNEF